MSVRDVIAASRDVSIQLNSSLKRSILNNRDKIKDLRKRRRKLRKV